LPEINIRTCTTSAALAGAVLIAAAAAAPGASASGGAIDAGQALAERHCARCHAVGRAGASPVAAAPAFRGFAQRWPLEHLREALGEGIVVGHHNVEMPEFVFAPREIDDLLAYLEWLAADAR
jgi:cytochrome c